MYYIDIIILLIIILLIVILIYDVYRKDVKIIKKIEMFNEVDYDWNKLGPIKFIDADDGTTLGYFPNGEGKNGELSAKQHKIISTKGLSMTTIRIPRGIVGPPGDNGTQGPVGSEGPKGDPGSIFTGAPGKNGTPATPCTDGKNAPECLPCSPGEQGTPAPECGDAPPGPPGTPATPCIACLPGVRSEPADPCTPSPAPVSPGGAQHGLDASDCNCECSECDPTKCEDTEKKKKINGNDLIIRGNLNVNNTLNMKKNSKICFGDTCINKNMIDRINNI